MVGKRYTSVSRMLKDLSGDSQFNEEFDELVAQRQIVKHLIAMRSAKGVSQTDVADLLGVTQSRVSKLESGRDDDLRLGELKAYAKAFGMDIGIVFANRDRRWLDLLIFWIGACCGTMPIRKGCNDVCCVDH